MQQACLPLKNEAFAGGPSDHVIPDSVAFQSAVNIGVNKVADGKIVTFGISPTHPEIGYGYLEMVEAISDIIDASGVVH